VYEKPASLISVKATGGNKKEIVKPVFKTSKSIPLLGRG